MLFRIVFFYFVLFPMLLAEDREAGNSLDEEIRDPLWIKELPPPSHRCTFYIASEQFVSTDAEDADRAIASMEGAIAEQIFAEKVFPHLEPYISEEAALDWRNDSPARDPLIRGYLVKSTTLFRDYYRASSEEGYTEIFHLYCLSTKRIRGYIAFIAEALIGPLPDGDHENGNQSTQDETYLQGGSVNTTVGVLDLKSVPSGANVKINGKLKGKTPFKVELKPGRYTVRIYKKHYLAREESFKVKVGDLHAFWPILKGKKNKILGALNLKITRRIGKPLIYLNGKFKGRFNKRLIKRKPGWVLVTILAGKNTKWEKLIYIPPERVITVRVNSNKPIKKPKLKRLKPPPKPTNCYLYPLYSVAGLALGGGIYYFYNDSPAMVPGMIIATSLVIGGIVSTIICNSRGKTSPPPKEPDPPPEPPSKPFRFDLPKWVTMQINQLSVVQPEGGLAFSGELSYTPAIPITKSLSFRFFLGGSAFSIAGSQSYSYVLDYGALFSYRGFKPWLVEVGGGAQTWLSHQTYLGTGLVLAYRFNEPIIGLVDRLFVGYSTFFLPSLLTHQFKIGIGIGD